MIWHHTQMAMVMERSAREKEHETALNEMRYEQHERCDNTKHEHTELCLCLDEGIMCTAIQNVGNASRCLV